MKTRERRLIMDRLDYKLLRSTRSRIMSKLIYVCYENQLKDKNEDERKPLIQSLMKLIYSGDVAASLSWYSIQLESIYSFFTLDYMMNYIDKHTENFYLDKDLISISCECNLLNGYYLQVDSKYLWHSIFKMFIQVLDKTNKTTYYEV